MQMLAKRYNARNKRHLMYLRYQRNISKPVILIASERRLQILSGISLGKPYSEIASELGISKSCVEKHIEKLMIDNTCEKVDDLIILYADWEYANGQ